MRSRYVTVCIVGALAAATLALYCYWRCDGGTAPERREDARAHTAAAREHAGTPPAMPPAAVPSTTPRGRVDTARIVAETEVFDEVAQVVALTEHFSERLRRRRVEKNGRMVYEDPPPFSPEETHLLTQVAQRVSSVAPDVAQAFRRLGQYSNYVDVSRMVVAQAAGEKEVVRSQEELRLGEALRLNKQYEEAEYWLTNVVRKLRYQANMGNETCYTPFHCALEEMSRVRDEQGRYDEALAYVDELLHCTIPASYREGLLHWRSLLEFRKKRQMEKAQQLQ